LDGEAKEVVFDDFDKIAASVSDNRTKLVNIPLGAIIELLNQLGRSIVKDKRLATLDGASYISLWLRRDNLERICQLNFGNNSYIDGFVESGNGFKMMAQPRGIVCHWVASNVPTLSFFSLVMGILTKNSNVLKVSEENKDIVMAIIKGLLEIKANFDGKEYSGRDIVKTISVVSFESSETAHSEAFSMIADCKVIWGGGDSVRSITALPQKETCETIPFGPKYSFGIFDKGAIEGQDFRGALRKTLQDVLLFDQMACSSPQVLFFEKSSKTLKEIAQIMKEEFEHLPKHLLARPMAQYIESKVINARGMYMLSDDADILASDGLDWTILISKLPGLEEPIHGGCIFIKEVGDINDVLPHITRKIQAIVLVTADAGRGEAFARMAAERGADRMVLPGAAHDFALPWDGIMALNRLVRWTILYQKKDSGGSDAAR
jgi:hypothetical protein